MKSKRILAVWLLLASMLLPSCSEERPEEDSETENTAEESIAETITGSEAAETKDYIDTAFEGIRFDGKEFNILTREGTDAPHFDHEEITGEPVKDAIYNEVVTVEEKFGVDVEYYPVSNVNAEITRATSAGDATYSTVIHSCTEVSQLVTENIFLDLGELKELQLDQPWWNETYRDRLTIGGKNYFAFGDMFFEAAIINTHLLYFNKEMCSEYGMEYPYQAVYDGKWTMDYLAMMTEGVKKDLNGDGVYNEKDQWGLVQSPIQSSIMYYTSGFSTMSFDEEGYPYLDMYSEEFVSFYEDLFNFDYRTDGIWTNTQAQEGANFQMFVEGKVLFSSHFLSAASVVRTVEFDVGILPYPKWQEDAEYINWPTGYNFVLGVPSVISPDDYTFVGTMLEALASQGYRFVRPALYEVTLQGKLARDPESQDMLDLIFDTMGVDFGWLHTGTSGMGWFVSTCLDSKLESITSFYERTSKRSINYYKEIVEAYRANE